MPDPVVIEFIDVADKIRWRVAIEQNRCPRVALQFDIAKGAVYLIPRLLKVNVQANVFPRR